MSQGSNDGHALARANSEGALAASESSVINDFFPSARVISLEAVPSACLYPEGPEVPQVRLDSGVDAELSFRFESPTHISP